MMNNAGNILILGANGQLGFELCRVLNANPDNSVADVRARKAIALDRAACDLSNPEAFRPRLLEWVEKTRPDVIINAAAYTAVDRAETELELAFAVNGVAPGILGEIAAERDILVVHYSTDYVFDGASERPYREDDPPNPLNNYGQSKLVGERALQASGAKCLIFRTSWVFGAHGGNFLKTMLKLASERETLAVIADQRGAPTSAAWLAEITAQVTRQYLAQIPTQTPTQTPTPPRQGDAVAFPCDIPCNIPFGLYHLTAAGATSWHGYAEYIFALARARGVSLRLAAEGLRAIPARDYPTPAARPTNSCLDCSRAVTALCIQQQPWQQGVEAVLARLF